MNVIQKKLSEIKPYEKNPRRNDEAVEFAELAEIANCRAAKEKKKERRCISFETAEEIRRIEGKTDREIAKKYGISRGTVWQIRNGLTYRYA